LNLRDVNQLFNTMDPSPFHEKDLDHDAEEFIESWALEYPLDEPIVLVIHLTEMPPDPETKTMVTKAVHHYFDYRARLNRMEFRRLMQEGRKSLLIGLLFVFACLAIAELLAQLSDSTIIRVLRESLTIGGWVALWRPLEIYLYDWWPLRHRGKALTKLSEMPVEIVARQPSA
jgi:hypothetical protein